MYNKATYSVLVVEDQRETVDRLRDALRETPDLIVAGVANTLADALTKLAQLRPNFVLTDLGLPDGSGIEVIHAVKSAAWKCDSMVFSVFGDEQRVISAIQAGAKGYILKTSTADMIMNDIRDVIAGGSPMSPKIARLVLNHLTKDSFTPVESEASLTHRERDVLGLIAQGYKRSEVSEKLGISVGTVGNHIHNTYRKFEVTSNIEAVMIATKSGQI